MPFGIDNQGTRVQSIKVNDDGKQQTLQLHGRAKERLGSKENGVPRIQEYGRTSHPPKGSNGHTVAFSGNPDCASVIGLEHPDYRPTKLEEGELKDYDKWGHYMHMKSDGWHWKVGGCEVIFGHNGVMTFIASTINIVGDVHAGGYGGVPCAMLGSMDDDTETNGADALVSNLATKVWIT